MRIERMNAANREEWDAFVARQASFGLLQSWEWGEFKKRLGWDCFRIAVRHDGRIVAGAQLLVRSLLPGLASVAYVPRGPVGSWLDERVADMLLAELHEVARGQRAVFLKIEPPLPNEASFHRYLKERHFRPSAHAIQPRVTIVLDLAQGLDAVWSEMRKKTRQYIRKAVRSKVEVRKATSADLPTFCQMMQLTGRRNHFAYRSCSYYRKEWQAFADKQQTALLLALHQDRVQAVRAAYRFGEHAAEFHAGSRGDSADLHANYLLVWEALKWAKDQGCSTYDLWGIPDEITGAGRDGGKLLKTDRTDGLWGVYQFKRGFGKSVVCYVGAYDYVYSRPLYRLAARLLRGHDALERVSAWLDQAHTASGRGASDDVA